MSDDGNRHGHLPTEGEPNLSENGSETMENDQPGLPSWAAALTAQVTAQLQATFEAQLAQLSVARRSAPKAKNFAKRKQFFSGGRFRLCVSEVLRVGGPWGYWLISRKLSRGSIKGDLASI